MTELHWESAANEFPRVLVVGQGLNRITGGGITLCSLFQGWDKAALASITTIEDSGSGDVCNRVFAYGPNEDHIVWPLSLFRRRRDENGSLSFGDPGSAAPATPVTGRSASLRSKGQKLIDTLGVGDYVRTLRLSEELDGWISDFAPQVLYSQLSSLSLIRLLLTIQERYGVPVVLHFMDDWPVTACRRGPMVGRARKQMEEGLEQLVSTCHAGLCIGEAMCEAYASRYDRMFRPFQNCIEFESWAKHSKQHWSFSEPFTIGYTGRVGTANVDSLARVTTVVSRLAEGGAPVRMRLVINSNTTVASRLAQMTGVEFQGRIPHDAMPSFLGSCDALLLPLDFDSGSQDFARYSMPSKLPEYLASGTPVVLVAPAQLAVTEYVRRRQCGLVIDSLESEEIGQAISHLMADEALRSRLGRAGFEVAMREHDGRVVRANFRDVFVRASQGIRV